MPPSSEREGVAEAHVDPRTRYPLREVVARYCRIIQLPENAPYFAFEVKPVAQEESKARGRRQVELIAELVAGNVLRRVARERQTHHRTNERGETVPALPAGDIELDANIRKGH